MLENMVYSRVFVAKNYFCLKGLHIFGSVCLPPDNLTLACPWSPGGGTGYYMYIFLILILVTGTKMSYCMNVIPSQYRIIVNN